MREPRHGRRRACLPFGGSAVKARSGAKATLIAYESRENRWRPFSAMNTASAAASSRSASPAPA